MLEPAGQPQAARRNEEIEVLRAVAVGMVLVEHIPLNLFFWHSSLQDFLDTYWHGTVGVDLFFTISGFVIARTLLPRLQRCSGTMSSTSEILTFWVHRFWRLQPSAWLWIAIPLVLCVMFNHSGAFRTFLPDLAGGLTGIFAVSNLRFGQIQFGQDAGLNFPYWSLSLEEQFYLLLPLLALLFRVRLAYVMGLLIAYQFAMPHEGIYVFTRPGAIAMGVLLAIWSTQPGYAMAEPTFLKNAAARVFTMTLMFVLLGALAGSLAEPLFSVPFGLIAVLSGMLVYGATFQRGYVMRDGPARRVMVWIGSRSYAIYLIHIPAYSLAREIYFRYWPPVWSVTTGVAVTHLVLGIGLTLIFSELNYRFVESPLRAYGRRIRVSASPVVA